MRQLHIHRSLTCKIDKILLCLMQFLISLVVGELSAWGITYSTL